MTGSVERGKWGETAFWARVLWQAPFKGHDSALIVPSSFAGVADGATPLDQAWPEEAGEYAAEALREISGSLDLGLSSGVAIAESITRVHRYGASENFQLTCTVAFASFSADRVEFCSLGDCQVFVQHSRGSVVVLSDKSLSQMDEEAFAIADLDARKARLLSNRKTVNSEGSYWAFAPGGDASRHVLRLSVPLSQLEWFLIGTDGAFRWIEANFASVSEALQCIADSGSRIPDFSEQMAIGATIESQPDDCGLVAWWIDDRS